VQGCLPFLRAPAAAEAGQTADDDVTAAGSLSRRAVTGLPDDVHQSGPPRVMESALLGDDWQTSGTCTSASLAAKEAVLRRRLAFLAAASRDLTHPQMTASSPAGSTEVSTRQIVAGSGTAPRRSPSPARTLAGRPQPTRRSPRTTASRPASRTPPPRAPPPARNGSRADHEGPAPARARPAARPAARPRHRARRGSAWSAGQGPAR
jgi:hypothetical protein